MPVAEGGAAPAYATSSTWSSGSAAPTPTSVTCCAPTSAPSRTSCFGRPRRDATAGSAGSSPGELFGNGNNEPGAKHAGDFSKSTTFTPEGDGFVVNGTKYYSTGTPYADHTFVTGVTDAGLPVTALLTLGTDGITVEDD